MIFIILAIAYPDGSLIVWRDLETPPERFFFKKSLVVYFVSVFGLDVCQFVAVAIFKDIGGLLLIAGDRLDQLPAPGCVKREVLIAETPCFRR